MSGSEGGAELLRHDLVLPREGDAERWIFYLHGILGAGRNWRSVARRLSDARPAWGGVLVDLRLHGRSEGFAPPHTLEACADDLERLVAVAGREPDALLGHSLGGKVALSYVGRAPARLRQAWIVDASPSSRRRSPSVREMLGTIRSLPGPFADRMSGRRALEDHGLSRRVARWMATHLAEGATGEWRWGLDTEALEALLADAEGTDAWETVLRPPEGVEIHFVKAEGSDVLTEEECRRIRRVGAEGTVRLHRLAGGHWLNVDNPDALLGLLEARLPYARGGSA